MKFTKKSLCATTVSLFLVSFSLSADITLVLRNPTDDIVQVTLQDMNGTDLNLGKKEDDGYFFARNPEDSSGDFAAIWPGRRYNAAGSKVINYVEFWLAPRQAIEFLFPSELANKTIDLYWYRTKNLAFEDVYPAKPNLIQRLGFVKNAFKKFVAKYELWQSGSCREKLTNDMGHEIWLDFGQKGLYTPIDPATIADAETEQKEQAQEPIKNEALQTDPFANAPGYVTDDGMFIQDRS